MLEAALNKVTCYRAAEICSAEATQLPVRKRASLAVAN